MAATCSDRSRFVVRQASWFARESHTLLVGGTALKWLATATCQPFQHPFRALEQTGTLEMARQGYLRSAAARSLSLPMVRYRRRSHRAACNLLVCLFIYLSICLSFFLLVPPTSALFLRQLGERRRSGVHCARRASYPSAPGERSAQPRQASFLAN